MKFRRKPASEEISGFLDKGTTLTGELQFAGQLQIHGNFHGSITTNDILVVGEHAVIHADIKSGQLEIHGRIFGSVVGKRRIEIYPTGHVQGDIQAPVLVIHAGGTLDGRRRMACESNDSSTDDIEAEVKKGANEAD